MQTYIFFLRHRVTRNSLISRKHVLWKTWVNPGSKRSNRRKTWMGTRKCRKINPCDRCVTYQFNKKATYVRILTFLRHPFEWRRAGIHCNGCTQLEIQRNTVLESENLRWKHNVFPSASCASHAFHLRLRELKLTSPAKCCEPSCPVRPTDCSADAKGDL